MAGAGDVKVLVIRHAVAEDRESFAATGESDDLRPITDAGRRKMRLAAKGLRRLVPSIGTLAASPLTRAAETARIIADVYGGLDIATVEALRPEASPASLLEWLREVPADPTVAVVGHDPHLSTTIGWLLGEKARPLVQLKKEGACLLQFDSVPRRGAAVLQWLLQPAQLRRQRR